MDRWTVDEARKVLGQWRASGQSAQAFGREHGINTQRLYKWRKRLAGERQGRRKREDGGLTRLVPAVVRMPSATDTECAVVVRLPGGIVIEADATSVSAQWLLDFVGGLTRQ